MRMVDDDLVMFDFRTVKNSDMTKELLDKIIRIKSVAWFHYGYEQQLMWIEHNINSNDIHVILLEDDIPVAYLNLISIEFSINGNKSQGYGIGNVCALRTGLGYGKELMNITNQYLISGKKTGVLLCKENLVDFYKKTNWVLLDRKIVLLNFDNSHIELMVYNVGDPIYNFVYLGKSF